MKRILIASTQYPYYGGAATNAYALVKYFRSKNIPTAGIFFDSNRKPVDPDKINGVWRIKDQNTRNLSKRMIIRYLGGRPDIILAKNYGAPIHAKNMFPDAKVVYLVTGSPHMIKLSGEGISAKRYLKSKRADRFGPEAECIKQSDLVVPNSHLGRELLIKHYGAHKKITAPVDTSMALNRPGKVTPFKDRKYDITFVASNLKRDVKNSKLAKNLYGIFKSSKKAVIGSNNEMFRGVALTDISGILSHKEVINIISNSRLVICTSYYDASPNTIKEALACGSNILISKNCGWSEIYPEEFVCNDVYDLQEWKKKASHLIKNDIKYNIGKAQSEYSILEEIERIVK